MTLPTYKVEVAWASTPFSGAPTFTDVSADVQMPAGVPITFGRPDEYSATQPSTASFRLANKSGKYSPDNASSALYPNVIIGKAVRITANEGGSSYARFFGYIDDITVSFTALGIWSDVDITCVDLLSLLGRRQLANDIIKQYALANGGPIDYWQMGDPSGTTTLVNIGGGPTKSTLSVKANPTGNPGGTELGNATGPGTDGLTAAQVTNSYMYVTNGHAYTADFAVMAFFRIDTFDSVHLPIIAEMASVGALTLDFTLSVDASGFLRADFVGLPGGDLNLVPGVDITAVNVADGNTHCVVWRASVSGTTTCSIFLDGVSLGVKTTGAITGGWLVFPYRIGQTGDALTASTGVMTISQVAIFENTVTWPNPVDVSNAGLNGFSGESSAARFTRIAGLFGITPTVPTTPGTTSMGPLTNIAGRSVLDLLQEVQDTENGVMYVSPSGTLTLVGRPALYNQAAAVTLTAGMYQPDLQFTQNSSQFANDVTATGTSGVPQEYSDATSITNYGTSSPSPVSLNTTLDAEAYSYAAWRVGTGNPVTRAPQLSIDLLTQQSAHPTLLAAWWQVTPGQLAAVSGLPSNAPSSSVTLQVQGWTETLTDLSYSVTVNTGPNPGNYWKLGNATYGLLGSTTILSY